LSLFSRSEDINALNADSVFPQLLSQFLALHLLRVIRSHYENKGHAFALFASRVRQRTLPH
jgi:hypothetical protein